MRLSGARVFRITIEAQVVYGLLAACLAGSAGIAACRTYLRSEWKTKGAVGTTWQAAMPALPELPKSELKTRLLVTTWQAGDACAFRTVLSAAVV